MRKLYAHKRQRLEKLIAESALSQLPVLDTPGGMHMVLGLPAERDEAELIRQLNASGLGVRGLSGYCEAGAGYQGLVIGYCADSEAGMASGLALIERHLLAGGALSGSRG